jgi:hypothetical protein
MYTLESLTEFNGSDRNVSEEIVVKVNGLIKNAKESRNNLRPVYGDMVRYTDKYGKFYANSRIEMTNEDKNEVYLCESGSAWMCEDSISIGSGGAFTWLPMESFKLIGTKKAWFQTWGSRGACASGSVNFEVEVNLWECNANEQEYSTEFYDRYFVYINNEIDLSRPDRQYKYNSNGNAWRTDEEFYAWLRTYRGIIVPGYDEKHCLVWTYKESMNHLTPMDEYLAITDCIVDTETFNGRKLEVKRRYDDENHIVYTWLCREMPELDWRTTKNYAYARTELMQGGNKSQ